ncbi:MAG: M48 family metallopeptidase [Desulfoplanes sp.]
MSIYLSIVLFSLLVSWALTLFLESINIASLNTVLPEAFAGMYSPKAYAKSQEYARSQAVFGMITATFDVLVLILCILAGGFDWLDTMIRGMGWSYIVTGLVYFGALGLAGDLLSLPFSLYHTFVLEERFGFNKTTMSTFWKDRFKGYALSLVFGGIILGGVLWFFEQMGDQAWIWCWVFTTMVMVCMQYLAPRFILPLFNTFTPIEPGETKDAITSFARKTQFSLAGIFVMDGSKRSAKSNAFFTGLGNKKRIALFDTLLKEQSTPELVAILAHEIGHYKHRHMLKGLMVGIIKTGIIFLFLGMVVSSPSLYTAFGITHPSSHTGLVIFALLYTPVSLVLGPLSAYVSRKHEFQADAFAAHNLEDPQAMISALKKLSVSNLSNLTPHPWYVAFYYSHPPVLERIRAIEKICATKRLPS